MAKKLQKEKGKKKPKQEDPQKEGQIPHYHDVNRDNGHAFYSVVPGATLGIDIFGDNIVSEAVNFINPLSDIQDVVDLFTGDEDEEDDGC